MKLRKFEKGDAKDIVKNANNPKVAMFLREVFPEPYTIESAKWWVSEGHQLGNVCNMAIEIDGECAGSIGATFFEGEHRYTVEIGYWIGESHWSKGIATKAIDEFPDYIFKNYDVKRIYAPVAHQNTASIKALKKCGFECEGILKNNMYLRGAMYDEHIYAKHS